MHEILHQALEAKDKHISLFDALVHVVEEEGLKIDDVAKVVKKNKFFMGVLQRECNRNKMFHKMKRK